MHFVGLNNPWDEGVRWQSDHKAWISDASGYICSADLLMALKIYSGLDIFELCAGYLTTEWQNRLKGNF